MEQQSLSCGTSANDDNDDNDNDDDNDASPSHLSNSNAPFVDSRNPTTSDPIHKQKSFHYKINKIRSHMQGWNPFICNWKWRMFVARWGQVVVDEKCCYDQNCSCPRNWLVLFKQ